MPLRRAGLLLALALAGALRAESPLRQPRFSPLRTEVAGEVEVPVRVNRRTGLILVPVRVGDQESVFLLDTGASHSVITPDLADRAGLDRAVQPVLPDEFGNLGREPIPVARVNRLEAGAAAWEQFDALVMDLAHLEKALGEPLDGILGMNVLGQAPFTLDLPRSRIGLYARPPRPDIAPLPSRVDRRRYWVRARLDGKDLELLLDTGSSRTFVADPLVTGPQPGEGILPHSGADSADHENKPGNVLPSTASRTTARATPSTLSIGSISLSVPSIERQGAQNLLGMDLLRRVKTVVDPGRQRVWMLPEEVENPVTY